MKVLINIIIVLAFVVIGVFASNLYPTDFEFLIVLPLSTLFFTILFYHKLKLYKNSIVSLLILVQVVIRYLFLPLLIVSSDIINTTGLGLYKNDAILIMVVELFVVYTVLGLNSSKYLKTNKSKKTDIILISSSFGILSILGILMLFIYLSGYFTRVNYIWELSYFVENKYDLEEVSSFAAVLFYPVRMILSLLVISYFYKRKKKSKYAFLGILLVLLANSIIIVGTSRFSIVLAILPLFYLTYINFRELRKPLGISFVVIFSFVIILSSINKFSNNQVANDPERIVSAKSLNSYFSGPNNESKGLEVYWGRGSWERFDFLVSDLFQNVPVLSKLTNDNYKTNIYFNEAIYGHRLYQDQIVPLSLNGLIHYGLLGPIIYPVLFLSIALYYERKFLSANHIGFMLVYSTIAITLSLVFMLNIGSLVATIFRNLLFLFVPILIIRFINIKL